MLQITKVSCWLILYHKISKGSIEKPDMVLYTIVIKITTIVSVPENRCSKNGG